MGIQDYSWDDLPKDLTFQPNDTITFMIEKLTEVDDVNQPQIVLECRIVTSDKSEEFIGEKVNLFFKFKTKAGTSNRATFNFLKTVLSKDMAELKTSVFPYSKLVGKMFTAVAEFKTYEGKDYLNWNKYTLIGDADNQEF